MSSQRRKPIDPCKKNACKIQACLDEHRFQESACLDVLEEMRQCCLKYKDVSLCCSGIHLEKPYTTTTTTTAATQRKSNGKSSSHPNN